MSKKIAVIHKLLLENEREKIREAAKRRGYEVAFYESNQEAMPHLADAEIIYGQGAELIKAAPGLKWLCSLTAGVENYLSPQAGLPEDAILSNSSGAYGVTIAEHIVMVTLMLLRRMPEYTEIVRQKQWVRTLPIHSIRDSRVLILGTGDIGREAARRIRSFTPASITGINRSGLDKSGLFDQVYPSDKVEEVLPLADIVIACLPGTKETGRFLSRERLSLLPEGAFLVNVGRGSALDEEALLDLLRDGHIAGAALDVFDTEPLPADHPFYSCEKVLITPHCSGNMTLPYTVRKSCELFLEDFENYCAGRPLAHAVDRTRGY